MRTNSDYLKGFLTCLVLAVVVLAAVLAPRFIRGDKQKGTQQARDPFVGYWKLDDAKLTLPTEIDSLGGNRYSLTFPDINSSDRLALRTVQLVADGADRVTGPDESVSLTQDGAKSMRLTWTRKGQQTVDTITLSPDGELLTLASSSGPPVVLKRIAGTGMTGRWEGETNVVTSLDVEFSPRGADGLLLSFNHQDALKGVGETLTFDDKERPSGDGPGWTMSSRRFDDRTIEEKRLKDNLADSIDEYHVSGDGSHLVNVIRLRDLNITGVIHYTRVGIQP